MSGRESEVRIFMEPSLFHDASTASNRILYTPSPFAKEALLHLQEIGELKAAQTKKRRRSGLTSYLFFLVEEGEGEVFLAGERYALRAGDAVFFRCEEPYAHRSSEHFWRLRWVHFYGGQMPAIYEKYLARGGKPAFTATSPERYRALWERLFRTAGSDDYIRDMRINEELASLLTLLLSETRHLPADEGHGRRDLCEVKAYLDAHLTEKLALDALAGRFFINKYYLTRRFHEQFGVSIGHYLLTERVTRAKHFLRFTDRSIEEIGTLCGMEDPNYFARMFRRVEGVSPRQFRRMWAG